LIVNHFKAKKLFKSNKKRAFSDIFNKEALDFYVVTFKDLRRTINVKISLKYIFILWALFILNLILYSFFIYRLVLYYASNTTASYNVFSFLYSNISLVSIIEIFGFLFIGTFALIEYKLLQSLKTHREKLIQILSQIQIPNLDSQANEIKNLKMPNSLLLPIIMVFFFFIPLLGIVSLIISFYVVYKSHNTLKELENLEDKAFSLLGIKLQREKTQKKNFVLYFIVILITIGFFMLYLIFEAIKEFNHHVEEDYRLLESIDF